MKNKNEWQNTKLITPINLTPTHVFGLWEEVGVHREHPHRHRKKKQSLHRKASNWIQTQDLLSVKTEKSNFTKFIKSQTQHSKTAGNTTEMSVVISRDLMLLVSVPSEMLSGSSGFCCYCVEQIWLLWCHFYLLTVLNFIVMLLHSFKIPWNIWETLTQSWCLEWVFNGVVHGFLQFLTDDRLIKTSELLLLFPKSNIEV